MEFTKRDVLTLIPAALAAAPALAAASPAIDPHPELVARYRAAEAEWSRLEEAADRVMKKNGNGSAPHETARRAAYDAHERSWAIFREIVETPVTTAAGLAALVDFFADEVVSYGSWKDDVDVSAAENIRAGVRRLAGVA